MNQHQYLDDEESFDKTDPLDPDEAHESPEALVNAVAEVPVDFLLTDVTQIYFNEIGQNALLTAK